MPTKQTQPVATRKLANRLVSALCREVPRISGRVARLRPKRVKTSEAAVHAPSNF